MLHLILKFCRQPLSHLPAGRDELHLRRRLRENQASDPVKSSISSATTNSESKASLLPLSFIVTWKVKNKRIKRIRSKGIEKFHLLVGLSVRVWHNWMFAFKVISHKSSWELLKCDRPAEVSASVALTTVSNRRLCLTNKKMALQTLEIGWSGRGDKSWSWSPDVLIQFSGTSQTYGQELLRARLLYSLRDLGKRNWTSILV